MRALLLLLPLTGCLLVDNRPKAPPLTAEDRRPLVIVGEHGSVHVCGPARWRLEERWYLDRECELVETKPDPEVV